eukprot:SAG11_NODE_5714_length_1481_cov_0.903039_1_plen_74_part_10
MVGAIAARSPAPNLFMAQDERAPRWSDSSLISKPLELTSALLGLWHDWRRIGPAARSSVANGASASAKRGSSTH